MGTGFEEFAAFIFTGGADPLKAKFSIFIEVPYHCCNRRKGDVYFYKVFKVYTQL